MIECATVRTLLILVCKHATTLKGGTDTHQISRETLEKCAAMHRVDSFAQQAFRNTHVKRLLSKKPMPCARRPKYCPSVGRHARRVSSLTLEILNPTQKYGRDRSRSTCSRAYSGYSICRCPCGYADIISISPPLVLKPENIGIRTP